MHYYYILWPPRANVTRAVGYLATTDRSRVPRPRERPRDIQPHVQHSHVEAAIHNNNAIKRIFYKIKTRKYIYKTRQIKLEMVLVSQIK